MRKFCTSSKVYSCRSAWETELWFIIHYSHSLLLDILHLSTSCSLFIIHTGASVYFNALPVSAQFAEFLFETGKQKRSVTRNATDCPDVSCNCFSFGKFYQNREIIVLAAACDSSLCYVLPPPASAQAESVAAAGSQCQNILKSVSSFLSSVLNCKTLTILLSLVLRLCFSFCNPLRSGYHSGYLVMAGKRN